MSNLLTYSGNWASSGTLLSSRGLIIVHWGTNKL